MTESDGYVSKALRDAGGILRGGVKTADGVIDKAVEVGSGTAKKAMDAGSRAVEAGMDVGDHTRRMVAGKTEIEMLERLGNMWREGMLTDGEFQRAKTKILDRL